MMTATKIRLKKNEDRRIKAGHLWIFSNEIDTAVTPLTRFEPGQTVIVENNQSQTLGVGYINPHCLLSVRLFSRSPKDQLNAEFIQKKIQQAVSLREFLFGKPFYRAVFGESDGLPGLIVDRYAEILVVQIATAGMEKVKNEIITALCEVLKPAAILWRNDSSIRELENLPRYVEAAFGKPPEIVSLEENNVRFQTSIWQGQKTGWFYDHRENRARMKHYVKDKRVLDLFSYIGGWGIQAAVFGAKEVYCVDSSAQALGNLEKNAQLNSVAEKIKTLQGDAFSQLKTLQQNKELFDVIVVDPPAFIKKRKDIKEGSLAYQRINELTMDLLPKDGILISSSCSLHMSRDMLQQAILRASLKARRNLQIIGQGHQGSDHPVHPAIAETDYLKTFFCRLT
jgi:23S rRNA (cytosine1962-C5)-methyltransferase